MLFLLQSLCYIKIMIMKTTTPEDRILLIRLSYMWFIKFLLLLIPCIQRIKHYYREHY